MFNLKNVKLIGFVLSAVSCVAGAGAALTSAQADEAPRNDTLHCEFFNLVSENPGEAYRRLTLHFDSGTGTRVSSGSGVIGTVGSLQYGIGLEQLSLYITRRELPEHSIRLRLYYGSEQLENSDFILNSSNRVYQQEEGRAKIRCELVLAATGVSAE